MNVLVCYAVFLQMSQCEGDLLDQALYVFYHEKFVSVQTTIQQLSKCRFDVFEEQ